MRNDGSVARFICHSLGLRRTSAQGAVPESAPLVDLVFPLEEGVSLSTLPSSFIHTLFPLHRRALDHPTMGTPDLGASGTALRWWVLPTYFRVLGRVMVQDEAIEEASRRSLDCALSEALYAVLEEEAGDMPPAVVVRCGLRHVADFYVPARDCVACHNLFVHFCEEVRAAGPGWATQCRVLSRAPTDRRTYSCLLHPSSCPFSAVPPSFRLPLFFASDVHPCSRGLLGWEVTLEVEVQLTAPNCFFEHAWQSDAALDLLFPFDRSLHRWLGAFIRLQGLLEIRGRR